jgi:NTE family protein
VAEVENVPASATPTQLLDGGPGPRGVGDQRALVLGGGGSAGNAWEIGVIAGLLEGGLDVTDADLIVGTSAGATVAAQITCARPADLLAAVLSEAPPRTASEGRRGPVGAVSDHMERTSWVIAAAADAADMRRRMGAASLELHAASDGAWHARWRAIVAARLPSSAWPDRRILITAVDATTGDPVVFDRHSGVDLVDAVAASTSASLPHVIGDSRYIDGGYRRNENADLAVGCSRVLVLSPFGGRTRHPLAWRMQLAAQIDELRAGGSRVVTVFPDADALEAFGDTMMDPSTRPPAARAGYNQGRGVAAHLTRFWR